MGLIERDVVLQGKDESGRDTIDLPVTRLGLVEGTADIKETPADGDYIPVVDSADGGKLKKTPLSALMAQAPEPEGDEPLTYGKTDGQAGKFDRKTTAPTAEDPLRYNGVFRATKVFGVYYSDAADVAETYQVEGETEPGDLIAIGRDGNLARNTQPGGTRVLGVVSERPGLLLGGQVGVPIALAGRVRVKAEGAVCAGDYLAAGHEPGAAHAVSPEDAARGSVVAIALEGKESAGVGLVMAMIRRM